MKLEIFGTLLCLSVASVAAADDGTVTCDAEHYSFQGHLLDGILGECEGCSVMKWNMDDKPEELSKKIKNAFCKCEKENNWKICQQARCTVEDINAKNQELYDKLRGDYKVDEGCPNSALQAAQDSFHLHMLYGTLNSCPKTYVAGTDFGFEALKKIGCTCQQKSETTSCVDVLCKVHYIEKTDKAKFEALAKEYTDDTTGCAEA